MTPLSVLGPRVVLVKETQSFDVGFAAVLPHDSTAAAATFNGQLSHVDRPERLADHHVGGDRSSIASVGDVALDSRLQHHFPQPVDPRAVGELMDQRPPPGHEIPQDQHQGSNDRQVGHDVLAGAVELHLRYVKQSRVDGSDAKDSDTDGKCRAGDGDQSP